MNLKTKKMISTALYVCAALAVLLSIWTFVIQWQTLSTMIKGGQITWSGHEQEIIGFFAQNAGAYFFQAVVLGYIGYAIAGSQSVESTNSNKATSSISNEGAILEIKDEKIESPLKLLSGSIKTHLSDDFIKLTSYSSEVLFNSEEKIEITEAYDSEDGSKEVLVFDASSTWDTLKTAVEKVAKYYDVTLDEEKSTFNSEKLVISETEKYGQASGFYVLELGTEIECYLFLEMKNGIQVVRYTSFDAQEDIVKVIKRIETTL